MDKLQPLIRNRFWILAGLVIPLVLYGYYSANSSLKAATADRAKTLDDLKSKVSSGNEPNDDYIKKLEHINTFLEASVQDAIVDLWRKQQERMTWPQAVASRIPAEFMSEFEQQVPFIYKGIYPELIRRLQKRAQPVEPIATTGGQVDRSGRPITTNTSTKATANQKLILAAMVPHAQFGQFGITSQEMWDAQIDIWFTEILLDAIVKMNQEKESISEAVIRRIDLIELVGGTGERATKDQAAEGGGMGGMEGMGGMPGGMGGMGGGNQAIPTEIGFLPDEEFGPATEGGADGGGGMEMAMEGGGASGPAPPKRYIAETEESPFLERGFYLSVIIQQTKIADFIVTLANSDWPVQVRRFQVGVNPYRVDVMPNSDMFGGAGGEMGMGGMGMGGMGMGGMSGLGGGGMGSRGAIGSRSSGMSRGRGGFEGGMGGGMQTGKQGLINLYDGTMPEFAMGSLNHPDLVRLDLCGVITMYKQPKEALAAIEARKAEAASQGAESGLPPVTPADLETAPAMPVPATTPSEAELDPAAPTLPPDASTPAVPMDPAAPPVEGSPDDPAAPVVPNQIPKAAPEPAQDQ